MSSGGSNSQLTPRSSESAQGQNLHASGRSVNIHSSIGSQREVKSAGVGIYFQEENADVVVGHLIRGGSGERTGTVQAGDVVLSVDGEDMTGRSLNVVRNTIIGPEGSEVTVGFRRKTQRGEIVGYTVELMRGTPDYLQMLFGEPPELDDSTDETTPLSTPRMISGTSTPRLPSKATAHLREDSKAAHESALEAEITKLRDERTGFQEALRTEIGRRRQEERLRHEAEQQILLLKQGPGLSDGDRIRELEAQLEVECSARAAAERRLSAAQPSTNDLDRLHETITTLSEKLADAEGNLQAERSNTHRLATSYASLQAAQAHPRVAEPSQPIALDQEFKDVARMSIIAIPHLVHHIRTLSENPDSIKAALPASMVLMQTVEPARVAAITTIPQSIAHLVSLLQSKQATTVREASFALALTTTSSEGREAILCVQNAVAHIAVLLNSEDAQTCRHATLSIGNLAMDPVGRRAMMTVFSVIEDLTKLVGTSNLDCARGAALALGNLVVEEDARGRFLQIPMSVRTLAERLKSVDHLIVRYATGAMRNVAAEEKGRRAVLAQQDAVAALKGLLSSPDAATARFAESALKNLSLTPFSRSTGNHDPRNGRVQVPYRADKPRILGMELPFSDSDGLGIPEFRHGQLDATQRDSSSIAL